MKHDTLIYWNINTLWNKFKKRNPGIHNHYEELKNQIVTSAKHLLNDMFKTELETRVYLVIYIHNVSVHNSYNE